MNADSVTFSDLKREVISLCRRKGWGDNGIQHPQHIAMAMAVEVSEVLEHFADMPYDLVARLEAGGEAEKRAEIAEEIADVMNYSLQILYTLGVDISSGFDSGLSDDTARVSDVTRLSGAGGGVISQAMNVSVAAGGVLEKFQFMREDEVQLMMRGGLSDARRGIGCAFHEMLFRLFRLANTLGIDIAAQVARKIAIVDRRVYSDDEPAR